MQDRPEIPEDAFSAILEELQRKPLAVNAYRKKSGEGRSQAFGVVNRRCLPPDYSRQCWQRPYLYKLLLDFAAKYVDISYNAITVNQNYQAAPHYDRGNVGDSFLVAFGPYSGGNLKLHQGPSLEVKDIRHKPIVGNFSTTLHSVEPFQGSRYSLVFYTLRNTPALPPPSVVQEGGIWRFKRGEETITRGLPHPLQRGLQKEQKRVEIRFE